MARPRSDRTNEEQEAEIRGTPSAEERLAMIREAAYYRAQQRGFAAGDPVRDWCEAEREVERRLRGDPEAD